jgi:hypothetical protein
LRNGGLLALKSWKAGKYRDLARVKEAFCTKNSQPALAIPELSVNKE